MACESRRESLERYLDGTLPASDVPALEAHLKTCAACAAEALARRELQLAIREAGTSFRPRAAFRARIEGRRGPRPVQLLSLAAALLVGLGVFALRGARPRADLGLVEAVDLHVTALGSVAPFDVVSTDSHTVKPWFEGKVPFTFDLPDFSGSPFTLLGGKLAWIDGRPTAQLVVGVRKHKVSVFILDERSATEIRDMAGAARTFRVRSFASKGLRYVVVSDTGAEDVDALAKRFGSEG
jgi:anti-sigma factor RsiW